MRIRWAVPPAKTTGNSVVKIFALAALGLAALTATAHADDRGLSTIKSGNYVMDKTHGYVTFSYTHMGFSKPILRFDNVDATVDFKADKPASSKLNVTIDPASISTGVAKFDEHMKSADFLDVAKFNTITFKSTAVNFATPTTGTLTGDLTIKGVTKPVTLDVTLNKAGAHPFSGADTFGISATGRINRADWGLGAYIPNVSGEVDLRIEAEFSRK